MGTADCELAPVMLHKGVISNVIGIRPVFHVTSLRFIHTLIEGTLVQHGRLPLLIFTSAESNPAFGFSPVVILLAR